MQLSHFEKELALYLAEEAHRLIQQNLDEPEALDGDQTEALAQKFLKQLNILNGNI